jgi:hypothetical protein
LREVGATLRKGGLLVLTAATGSIRDARRAGTYAASDAINTIATAEPDTVSGSVGDSSNRTPARSECAAIPAAIAAGIPMASPPARSPLATPMVYHVFH